MHGGRWRWGWKRRGGRGRPPKPRRIWFEYGEEVFYQPMSPDGSFIGGEPVVIRLDEIEALRLVYVEKLSQEEAAKRMGVSRGTLWRLLESGRRKLVGAVVERRPFIVSSSGE